MEEREDMELEKRGRTRDKDVGERCTNSCHCKSGKVCRSGKCASNGRREDMEEMEEREDMELEKRGCTRDKDVGESCTNSCHCKSGKVCRSGKCASNGRREDMEEME